MGNRMFSYDGSHMNLRWLGITALIILNLNCNLLGQGGPAGDGRPERQQVLDELMGKYSLEYIGGLPAVHDDDVPQAYRPTEESDEPVGDLPGSSTIVSDDEDLAERERAKFKAMNLEQQEKYVLDLIVRRQSIPKQRNVYDPIGDMVGRWFETTQGHLAKLALSPNPMKTADFFN